MTNGDKWRATATDKQIAVCIIEEGCVKCPIKNNCKLEEPEVWGNKCKTEIVRWLKSEAKEND